MRWIVSLLLLAGCAGAAWAGFRDFLPIAQPDAAPPGYTAVAAPLPLPRPQVEQALRDFFAKWNSGELREALAEDFFDKDRLSDEIAVSAPADARLSLLSLQAVQLHQQYEQQQPDGSRVLLSRVSVRARTQLEFNDPIRGLQRLDGTHEYHFTVTAVRQ